MEWCFETGGGVVRICQQGDQVTCQALRGVPGDGLYKAWLLGEEGRFLLGTLIPEGGGLRLRRNLSVAQLQRQGAWPPLGAEIAMAFPFSAKRPPSGFRWEERPWQLTQDPLLIPCLQRLGPCLIRKSMEGTILAIPFRSTSPFPLPPLFCLSQVTSLDGTTYLLFFFSSSGQPVLPYDVL